MIPCEANAVYYFWIAFIFAVLWLWTEARLINSKLRNEVDDGSP